MSRKGDVVHFKAADNLYVNDVLVLPKGQPVSVRLRRLFSRYFGKDGRHR